LQRCPRNSVEQLGQTDDASFLRRARAVIAGTSVAALVVAVLIVPIEVVKTDEPLIESRAERDIGRGVELMFGVVVQIVVAQIMDEKHDFARIYAPIRVR
jgi:hypothetical protein